MHSYYYSNRRLPSGPEYIIDSPRVFWWIRSLEGRLNVNSTKSSAGKMTYILRRTTWRRPRCPRPQSHSRPVPRQRPEIDKQLRLERSQGITKQNSSTTQSGFKYHNQDESRDNRGYVDLANSVRAKMNHNIILPNG